MKYLISILFLFSSLITQAQTLDTAYIINVGGVFYTITQTATPIEDTLTLQNHYTNIATDAARQFAQAVNTVWDKPNFVERILAASQNLMSATGKSIIRLSVERFGDVAIGAWTVTLNGGAPVQGTMAIGPNSNSLRLTIAGTTYTLLPVGDSWVRLQNYPPGEFTDLFREEGTFRLKDIPETVILTKQ